MSDLAAQCKMAKCMISTCLKNNIAIKAADVTKGATTVHSKQRLQKKDEDENLLLILTREKELDGGSISEGIICDNALRIYADLLKIILSTSAECESGFTLKKVETGLKNLNINVKSIVLLGMEMWPVQARKQPNSILTNSVTS